MKMNKIVASVSAAALAVSALATNAFAANVYTVDMTHQEADYYNVSLKQTISSEALDAASTWGDYALVNKLTYDIVNTSTKKFTINGKVSAAQQFKASKDADSEQVTANIGKSDDIKDAVVKKNGGKTTKNITPAADTTLMKLVDDASPVAKDGASTTLTVEVSFTLPANMLGSVINITGSGADDYKGAFNGYGLLKGADAEDFTDALEDGVLYTTDVAFIQSVITIDGTAPADLAWKGGFTSGKANTKWTVTEFEVKEKTVGETLSNDINYVPNIIELQGKKGFTIPAFEDLKNGGTMTLIFDKAPSAGYEYVVRAMFVNDQLNIKPVQQEYTVSNNTIKFAIPAGFTLDANGKYGTPTVYLQSVHDWTTEQTWPTLMKVEFTSEGAADVAEATTAPTANEGDDKENKPAETTAKPATPAAGDKNQPTGVAIAIVPAIVAAAGVIISKKRK